MNILILVHTYNLYCRLLHSSYKHSLVSESTTTSSPATWRPSNDSLPWNSPATKRLQSLIPCSFSLILFHSSEFLNLHPSLFWGFETWGASDLPRCRRWCRSFKSARCSGILLPGVQDDSIHFECSFCLISERAGGEENEDTRKARKSNCTSVCLPFSGNYGHFAFVALRYKRQTFQLFPEDVLMTARAARAAQ